MRKRPAPRRLEVLDKRRVSPHMMRVTLGGRGLAGFPDDQDGAYIKLRLENPASPDASPLVRTYTVRHYDPDARRLEVDFVVHESEGPAVSWALGCQPGDTIDVGGPGPKKPVDLDADWFLIVGDMSALPAITANIERLPRDSKGYALLEIISDEDRQALDAPTGLDVRWLVNPNPEKENTLLLDAVLELEWLAGRPYAWVAGEFSQSLAIRKLLKERHDLTRHDMYASSYWQIGKTEDGHRVSKQAVPADLDYSQP